jgi:hypothetical protein
MKVTSQAVECDGPRCRRLARAGLAESRIVDQTGRDEVIHAYPMRARFHVTIPLDCPPNLRQLVEAHRQGKELPVCLNELSQIWGAVQEPTPMCAHQAHTVLR